MKLFVVYHHEDYVGSFMQGVFSTEELAQKWIDDQREWPADECSIKERYLDDAFELYPVRSPALTQTETDNP
jgi:hypothetical protein